MPNFGDWKGGELPSYISQWSFQDECDTELVKPNFKTKYIFDL